MARPIVSLYGIAPGDPYERLVREITSAFSRLNLLAPRQGNFSLVCQPEEIDGCKHAVIKVTIKELSDAKPIGKLLLQILSNHVTTRPQDYAQIFWVTVAITVDGEEKFSSSLPILPT